MIDEDRVDEMLGRARALGTDYDVIADILDLVAEVRRLHATVEAPGRQNAERIKTQEEELRALE